MEEVIYISKCINMRRGDFLYAQLFRGSLSILREVVESY